MDAQRDLTQPVENPALLRALARLLSDPTEAAKDEVVSELRQATYLVAMISDELEIPADHHGQTVFGEGSEIQVLIAETDDGVAFLPLFTDWQAIGDYTDEKVNAIVMPAAEAWAFALHDEVYQGAVINPAGDALPLGRPMLEFLLADQPPTAH